MEIIAECSVSVNLQNTQYMGSDNRIMNLRVQSGCMATRGLALPQSYYTYLRWDQKNVYRRQPEKDLTVEAGWHLKGVDLCSGGIDLCEEASNAPLPWSTSATLSLFSKRIHFMPGICSAFCPVSCVHVQLDCCHLGVHQWARLLSFSGVAACG